ncbi:secreted antigen 1, partial [Babesia divergens]
MKFLGILRASALFILLSAFHGPRGIFCSNLKVNPSTESSTVEVPEISEKPKESTVESSSELSAPPPKSNLVFESSKWHDSKLASAVLFLKQFCKEVNTEKFSGKISSKSYVDLSRVCSSVYYTLDSVTRSLIPRYGPGSVSKRIETPGDLYENALRPEKFKDYSKWIVKNIQNIIKSYKKMLKESAKLTEEQLKTETSRGPLKYGFVYKGDWWSMSLGSADMV